MKKIIVLFLFHTLSFSGLNAQDSLPKYKSRYESYNDRIIVSMNGNLVDRGIEFYSLDGVWDSINDFSPSQEFNMVREGYSLSLQYAKFKFSYSFNTTDGMSDFGGYLKSSIKGYSVGYGMQSWDFSLNYDKFQYLGEKYGYNSVDSIWLSDKYSLDYNEIYSDIKFKPFKTGYVDQMFSANYGQLKTAFTVYSVLRPYHRSYTTTDSMISYILPSYWDKERNTESIRQTGIQAYIGVAGNLILRRNFFVSGRVKYGINLSKSKETFFDRSERISNGSDVCWEFAVGFGFNIARYFYFKIVTYSYLIEYELTELKITDSAYSGLITLGYRFKEPGFMKRFRDKIGWKL